MTSASPILLTRSASKRGLVPVAEGGEGGLIELRLDRGALGNTVAFIYKRLQRPAYVFTGMLVVLAAQSRYVWTVVSGERGMTGVREAVITAELLKAGTLTIESYRRSWAKDPYDVSYSGVDRSVLRFISDDEQYDARFPEHPLSKVRRILASLPASILIQSDP